ncbi:MAG: prolipoprotein diacylglyceryl transferase [Defluviitaleaceae bacterium]|nr:prolipoprotein diacylglyceryl transferase [Defluviitaleaceae bacterium]
MQHAPDIWFPNLGIELANISRTAISIFGFHIYWYAILIILGILAGYYAAVVEAKRTGQKKEIYMDLLIVGVISAFIGLRLFFVAFNWEFYRDDPLLIITGIRGGGLAIFGGIIGAVTAAFVFCKVRKLNMGVVFDTAGPSLALGQAIGRWGNFFNREAFGGFTDNLLAMRIQLGQVGGPVTPELLAQSVLERGAEYIQVHPTFLYESIWNLGLFILLVLYRPRKKFGGEVFWLYLLGYGFGRFFIEALRTDQLMWGNMPVSQAMAALICVGAALVISLVRLRKRG